MANVGRPKAVLELSDEERETLTRWARRRNSSHGLAIRSRIVLGSAEGLTNVAVAARCGVEPHTVAKWRRRFLEQRLDGLVDDPRPGRPARITTDQVEEVVVATLESTPLNATHWSRAKMAERSGLSKSTIGRIWKVFELKPHRADGFKLSTDPFFVEKVYDVVGLYLNPPESRRCAQHGRKVPGSGAGPVPAGVPDDARHAGEADPRLRPARNHDPVRGAEHRGRLGDLQPAPQAPGRRVQEVPGQDRFPGPRGLDVHLICDNYQTHKTPAVGNWLQAHPRFHMHFTPTYSSWLNQVERFFAFVTEDLLRRSDHRSVQALESDIRNWVKAWNENPEPFIWTKTAEQILESIGRLLKRISGAGH
jgi:transposase/transposase-like protein